jgi:hypothetical protein
MKKENLNSIKLRLEMHEKSLIKLSESISRIRKELDKEV